jgi:hypothetical protein
VVALQDIVGTDAFCNFILMFQKNPENYRVELPLSAKHEVF